MSRFRLGFLVVGAVALLGSIPTLTVAAPATKKPATKVTVEKKPATPQAKPPAPRAFPDDDRISGGVGDVAPDHPREPTSSEPSNRRTPGAQPALRSRGGPPVTGPRIRFVRPSRLMAGQTVVLQGEAFGDDGRVDIDLGDARIRTLVARWEDDEITTRLPRDLAGMVGTTPRPGRLVLHGATGIAYASVELVPDPATLVPSITSAPASVRPGHTIEIVGERFGNRTGRLHLKCPARSYTGVPSRWSDTHISADPLGTLSGPISSGECQLILTNRAGNQARRSIHLDVDLETTSIVLHKECDVVTGGEVIDLFTQDLLNGWVIRSVEKHSDNPRIAVDWVRAPVVGSDLLDAAIQCRSTADPRYSDTTAEVTITFVLEGPAGLPWH